MSTFHSLLLATLLCLPAACTRDQAPPKIESPASDARATPQPRAQPAQTPTHTATPPADDPLEQSVTVYLGPSGHWVVADGTTRFISKCNGAYADAELSSVLRALTAPTTDFATIAAHKDVSYQDIVLAMDAVVASGRPDVAFVAPEDLTIDVDALKADKVGCGVKSVVAELPKPNPDKQPPPTVIINGKTVKGPYKRAPGPAPSSTPDVSPKATLVVVISKTEVIVGKQPVATLKELEKDYALPALRDALKKHRTARQTLILQADRTTAAYFMNAVLAAANDAGFDDILFAVNRKN